jgi:NAD(P)-dependent dehydrogenase (short-subunit alcohol dehydrogenase family)
MPADRRNMMHDKQPTVAVLGASRGIGLGVAQAYLKRGWRVVATTRTSAGKAKLKELAGSSDNLIKFDLEITDEAQVQTMATSLSGTTIDVLFVNAGVGRGSSDRADAMTRSDFIELFVINALGPVLAIEAFRPLMREDGVVVVMSSNLASIAGNTDGGWEVYRASKASLNTLLRSYAARDSEDRKTYLALSPGWVKTDMGGPNAPLDVATSVSGMLSVIDKRRGQGGVAFVDYTNAPIPW